MRYERAQRLLREAGWLAFWSATHVVPDGGDSFFAEIQEVYDAIGESLDRFDWETTYDASGYLALLDTFSGHIAMEPSKRERLYDEIRRRLAQRPGGMLRRHWEAVLHVARRLPGADAAP